MHLKKENIAVVLLTVMMAFTEMTALPGILLIKTGTADVDPVYFALLLNFAAAFCICFLFKKLLIPGWQFGLRFEGAAQGFKKYGLPMVLAEAAVCAAFAVGLAPFDNTPSALRIIVEGIVYYVGVAFMEELYLRGLLQNYIEKCFGPRKNASVSAVLIASVLFGAGHIFGALGQPFLTVACKALWNVGLGIYFGSVYVRTRNLLVPVMLHFIVNAGIAILFCFTTSNLYPPVALAACLICFCGLGCYGLTLLMRPRQNS